MQAIELDDQTVWQHVVQKSLKLYVYDIQPTKQ